MDSYTGSGITADMITDEMREGVNRRLHESLGLCWHDYVFRQDGWQGRDRFKCRGCGQGSYFGNPDHPDYCMDLKAVAEVEALVVERVGYAAYGSHLGELIELDMGEGGKGVLANAVGRGACATAFERALTCLSLLELPLEGGDG